MYKNPAYLCVCVSACGTPHHRGFTHIHKIQTSQHSGWLNLKLNVGWYSIENIMMMMTWIHASIHLWRPAVDKLYSKWIEYIIQKTFNRMDATHCSSWCYCVINFATYIQKKTKSDVWPVNSCWRIYVMSFICTLTHTLKWLWFSFHH